MATTTEQPSLAAIFSRNLKRTRLKRQLSQEACAAKAGICTSYQSMLERGQRSPPLDTLEAIAKALDVRPADLLRA